MKTIGKILKEARESNNVSLDRVESITKIKKIFIKNIEEENWSALPPFPVVLGFVKNISTAIGVDPKSASAFLKRDYPPKKILINPKPDVAKGFFINPKVVFFGLISLVVICLVGYLVYQYVRFMSPPALTVNFPSDNYKTSEKFIIVSGKTDLDAKVVINNQPIILDSDGNFNAKVDVSLSTTQLNVESTSRSGKKTIINRKIIVE